MIFVFFFLRWLYLEGQGAMILGFIFRVGRVVVGSVEIMIRVGLCELPLTRGVGRVH